MNKSLWNFEKENNNYEMPSHKSNHFIDIDFLRKLLFIYNKDIQEGIETLTYSEKEYIQIKTNFIKAFQYQCEHEDILRVLFDFSNNIIKVKHADMSETYKYFPNLNEKESDIIECINLELFSLNEINEDFQAIMMLHQFDELTDLEKIEFMKNYMNMKDYIIQLESEMKACRKIMNELFTEYDNEFNN